MDSDDEDFRRAMALSLGQTGRSVEEDDVDDGDMMAEALARTSHIQPPSNFEFNGPGFGARRGDDDELQRALALSMEVPGTSEPTRVDDDDDIRRAVQMSLEEDERRRTILQHTQNLSEEEQMKMAIEESLKGSTAKPSLDDDADDETEDAHFQALNQQLRENKAKEREAMAAAAASRLSRSNSEVKETPRTKPVDAASPPKVAKKPVTTMPSRAEMEQERLARQRKLQGLPPDGEPEAKRAKTSVTPLETNAEASSSKLPVSDRPYRSRVPGRDAAGDYFLDGELRHTYLDVGTKTADPVWAIGDAMGKSSEMSLLIMSSYDWDFEFMKPHFPHPEQCPIVIIRPPQGDDTNGRAVEIQPGLAEVYPPMQKARFGNTNALMGSCHMKYAWIIYKSGRLRVIVSTANFVERDWRFIENTVLVQDFLPLSSPVPLSQSTPSHDFALQFKELFTHIKLGRALGRFAKSQPVPLRSTDDWESMNKWDWSRVTVKLVMSVPGKWQGRDASKYGFARLGEVVRASGWSIGNDERVVADFQSSSLGKLTIGWYSAFYKALGGATAETLSTLPKVRKPSGSAPAWPPFKVVFPSQATVDASELGRRGGGTMFVGSAWQNDTKSLFYDSNSKRGGVLLHAKALTAIYEAKPNTLGAIKRSHDQMENAASTVGGWVYIGSANFSPSAWGTVSRDEGEPVMNINNYEMGIVIPLPRQGAEGAASRLVPHKRPARRYASTDVPWDQKLID